ncbi:hypothetical protein Syun_024670 [Stephania yunnanensis]|uniref:OTU domain-containing protein n=1 Tax=Stephania yunnanensis TaxID=152371 RepID=A0AAP0I4T5_9MAGN
MHRLNRIRQESLFCGRDGRFLVGYRANVGGVPNHSQLSYGECSMGFALPRRKDHRIRFHTDAVELVTSPGSATSAPTVSPKSLFLMEETSKHFVGESSSSTSVSSQQDVEDDRMIAVVLSEEYAKLDNAVAGRLSNLAPIPLWDTELCEVDRLILLNVYGLYEVKVSGDGNCQFRALSDQMYRSPEHHKHLKDYHALYEWSCFNCGSTWIKIGFLLTCRSGEWGDHVTLQAAADKFMAKICLLTSFRDTCFIEINPQSQAPQRELWLSFWSEMPLFSTNQGRNIGYSELSSTAMRSRMVGFGSVGVYFDMPDSSLLKLSGRYDTYKDDIEAPKKSEQEKENTAKMGEQAGRRAQTTSYRKEKELRRVRGGK